MTPANWARMKEIFLAALEKPRNEREAFLSDACSDAALRQEVRKLLEAEDRPAVESPVAGILAEPALPAAIGRYRIVRLVGEGGMGAVYEAEQDQPRRTVALKVIKPGLASRELLRRFEHESQALGRLHHPGIAQIYEAGAADSGFGPQPYFAMEFIQGASLLKYAEAHQLSTRQRLELMAKICDAVHHAHQRGIIHRDLKPGNILVDETGQPKILDFGVARATDSDAQATRQTDLGQLVGTLAYMSPEQVLGDPLELDTRSDVYALGVMLFELLAGCLPYQIGSQLPKAVQTIREEDPARLSSISRVYRGDIETIVAKALEKDKARRYQSAANLAADIQRYLKDEPIMARRSSAAYQLRKFARRHRALVTGVAAVFVMLIAGVIASTWEAVRAERAVATANAINDFLQNDLLGQANVSNQARPGTKADLDLTVRTALDRAAARIAGKFDKQPLVEASIRQLMGDTYRQMGLFPEGQRQLEGALALRRRALGEEHRDTLETMNALALLYEEAGKYAQAEPLHTKVLEIRRRVLGGEHRSTLNSMNNLGVVYDEEGKYALAESIFAKALQGLRRTVGEEDAATLVAMKNLGDLYRTEGKYALAEPLLLKDLDLQRRVLGEDHPGTLNRGEPPRAGSGQSSPQDLPDLAG
jgi:tRNA A-37 threonylcarbamoyl transferase component Bud32/tetratricopeptide (TPR) repeat protein